MVGLGAAVYFVPQAQHYLLRSYLTQAQLDKAEELKPFAHYFINDPVLIYVDDRQHLFSSTFVSANVTISNVIKAVLVTDAYNAANAAANINKSLPEFIEIVAGTQDGFKNFSSQPCSAEGFECTTYSYEFMDSDREIYAVGLGYQVRDNYDYVELWRYDEEIDKSDLESLERLRQDLINKKDQF